MAVQSQSAAAN